MKTLTITDAKKNLGKWLTAAGRGQEIGIIVGDSIVALRKVEVEANDYAWREYGATNEELERFESRIHAEVERLQRSGKLISVPDNLEDALEKICRIGTRHPKATARASRSAKGRRSLGAS